MVVHFAGMPCDMDEIMSIANEHHLIVIEDAAQAFGASYKGKPIGSIGDLTCFSHDAYKPLPAATGGGSIATNNTDYATHLRRLVDYGFSHHEREQFYHKYFTVREVGMKYYMRETSAAIIMAHIPYVEQRWERRKSIAKYYTDTLYRQEGMRLPKFPDNRVSAYYSFITCVERRVDFIQSMKAHGITTRIPAIRNDIAPIFGGKRCELETLNQIEQEYVGLPIHNRLTDEDVQRITDAVKKSW